MFNIDMLIYSETVHLNQILFLIDTKRKAVQLMRFYA